MSAIVIGMGNPLLSDDGVGLTIARELRRCLAGRSDVDVVELHAGGLRLMEAMAGYDIAIVVDAIVSGLAPGTIHRLSLSDLPRTRSAHSSHDGSLHAAMDVGRIAGLQLPEEVRIWAIEAADVATFGETLTPCVDRAAARTVNEILGSLPLACDQTVGQTACPCEAGIAFCHLPGALRAPEGDLTVAGQTTENDPASHGQVGLPHSSAVPPISAGHRAFNPALASALLEGDPYEDRRLFV